MADEKETKGQWITGGNAPFREDLVAWPQGGPPRASAAAPEVAEVGPTDDVHAQLARAKAEVRRLHMRIESLIEENERLRRAASERQPR